tara:strand:+ start:47555 stop:49033 length:1479 start_codon:yes stop_codon:yes gene_type:complete
MFARIGNIVGYILILLGFSEIVPIGVAAYYEEYELIMPFMISALVTIFIGGALFFSFKDLDVEASNAELLLLLIVIWTGLPLFASMPFMTSGLLTKLTDAYFEAASALTTTGSTVLVNLDLVPHALLFWRALLQWEGGILVFTLAVAILPPAKIGGLELFNSALPRREVRNRGWRSLRSRLLYAVVPLSKVYMILTLICTILLLFSGIGLFDSLTTAMATLSSGGFTTHSGAGDNPFSGWTEFILIPFMLLAAMNFTYHWAFLMGGHKVRYYKESLEIRYFLYFMGVGFLLLLFSFMMSPELRETGLWRLVGLAAFTVASVSTTTGFAPDMAGLMPLSVVILCSALLFIGGTTGSTAGGFKILRVHLLLKHANRELSRLIHPHSIVPVRMRDLNVQEPVLYAVWTLLFVVISAIALATLGYAMMGQGLQSGLGISLANLYSAGGLVAIFAPDFVGYHSLSMAGKWLTSFIMIMGRLEVIALMVLFMPSFWRN